MRGAILLLALLIVVSCSAQQNDIDSLEKVLKANPHSDTTRIRLQIKKAYIIISQKPDEGIKLTKEALAQSEKANWQIGKVLALRQIAHGYLNIGDYPNSVAYSQDALKQAASLNDESLNASIYNNLGAVYLRLADYNKALNYFKSGLPVFEKLKNQQAIAISLLNVGLCYKYLNNLPDAENYLKNSIAIADANHFSQVSAFAYSSLGLVYDEKDEYKKALEVFNKSIDFAKQSKDDFIMLQSIGGLAEANIGLKNYTEAKQYANSSLKLSKQMGVGEVQKETYQMLSDIALFNHDYKTALEYYKNYATLKDSIAGEDKKTAVAVSSIKFEEEKKEAVLNAGHAAALQRQKTIRNASILIALIIIIGVLISFIFYKRNRDIKMQKNEAELKAEIANTEMKALRAQMNPHFIFNSLNSIADYIDKHQTQTASDFTVKFARLMRMVLENSEHKEISLADDLKALELYMQLERFRLHDKFDYTIQVDESIDQEIALVPPLILQPFVENSIWHGIAKKEGRGNITIHIQQQDGMMNCVVEDDGVGISETKIIDRGNKSIGMRITKDRIDVMNKMKNTNASVNVFNKNKGVRAEVKLPLELSF